MAEAYALCRRSLRGKRESSLQTGLKNLDRSSLATLSEGLGAIFRGWLDNFPEMQGQVDAVMGKTGKLVA